MEEVTGTTFRPVDASMPPSVPFGGNASVANPAYTGALAQIEWGGLHSLHPEWAQQATTYMSPPQVLRSVLWKPTEPAQASQWQFPLVHQGPGDESPTGTITKQLCDILKVSDVSNPWIADSSSMHRS